MKSAQPDLQSITNESFNLKSTNTQEGARLDIAMSGFWGTQHERTFCDVRVFNPHAPSNCTTTILACYRKHERERKLL